MADPMYTDSLFIKNHPAYDNDAKNRTHGEHYLYYNTPNREERMEMIYRSIGRQYDWDLEKYRMSVKSIDKGNKRRFVKNLARFIKHPFSYLFWRVSPAKLPKRFTHLLFIAIFFNTMGLYNVIRGKSESPRTEKRQN